MVFVLNQETSDGNDLYVPCCWGMICMLFMLLGFTVLKHLVMAHVAFVSLWQTHIISHIGSVQPNEILFKKTFD